MIQAELIHHLEKHLTYMTEAMLLQTWQFTAMQEMLQEE
jgi:hypothetical protein